MGTPGLDASRLRRGEVIAASSGVLLLVFMVALHWYGVKTPRGWNAATLGVPTSFTGWDALSHLRWRTGAPLDPRPRWMTLPPIETTPEEWAWTRAHLLLGAARMNRSRIQLADTWTYITAAVFVVWTATVLVGL